MLQTIVIYEKATLKVVVAMQVNTLVTEANILKLPTHEVLITSKENAVLRNGKDEMILNADFAK